eukprot:scaffold61898_cov72-Phaeocystis_antarctica.AAC.5
MQSSELQALVARGAARISPYKVAGTDLCEFVIHHEILKEVELGSQVNSHVLRDLLCVLLFGVGTARRHMNRWQKPLIPRHEKLHDRQRQ